MYHLHKISIKEIIINFLFFSFIDFFYSIPRKKIKIENYNFDQ